MPTSADRILQLIQKAQCQTGVTKGAMDYTSNPPVPPQSRNALGQYAVPAPSTSTDAEGQPFSRSNDAISNVDTEASRAYAPGSLVQAAINRGRDQRNAASYPQHTLAGAIAEAAIKHQVQVLGHVAGTQPGVESSSMGPGVLVGEDDDNPYVMRAFQQQVNNMTEAFKQSVGRYPVFGAPTDADDVEFQRAYMALRQKFWPADGGQES